MPDNTDWNYIPDNRYVREDVTSKYTTTVHYEDLSKDELIERLVSSEKQCAEYVRKYAEANKKIRHLESLVTKLEDRNLYYNMDERDKREKELNESLSQVQYEVSVKDKEINRLKAKNISLNNRIKHITDSNNDNINKDSSYSKYLDFCYRNGYCPDESEF